MFKKINIITFIMFLGVLLSISASPKMDTMEINNVVQFEKETEYIGTTQQANLDAVILQLKRHENIPVVIVGHYTEDYNIVRMDSLSALKRATQTREYLINKGVKNDIIVHVDMNTKKHLEHTVTFQWLTQFNK